MKHLKWGVALVWLAMSLFVSVGNAWHEGDTHWHTFNMDIVGYNQEIADFPGGLSDLAVHNNYAYVGGYVGSEGLFIVDAFFSSNPMLVGRFPIADARVNGVAVHESGDFVVVTNEANSLDDDLDLSEHFFGITLIDTSEKHDPKLISRLPITLDDEPLGIHRVTIHGDYAYLSPSHSHDHGESTIGMIIIDISDPSNPHEIARTFLPSEEEIGQIWEGQQVQSIQLHDISIHESASGRVYAVLAAWDAGVLIYDVTIPEEPLKVSEWHEMLPGFLNIHSGMISPNGELLVLGPEFCAGYTGHLTFLDISDIQNPTRITTWSRPGFQWASPGDGSRCYHTLHFFDFSDDGTQLFVAGYGSGVWALNISDPSNPQIIGSFGPEAYNHDIDEEARDTAISSDIPMTWDVEFEDGHVYVTDFNSGLYILKLIEDDPWQ